MCNSGICSDVLEPQTIFVAWSPSNDYFDAILSSIRQKFEVKPTETHRKLSKPTETHGEILIPAGTRAYPLPAGTRGDIFQTQTPEYPLPGTHHPLPALVACKHQIDGGSALPSISLSRLSIASVTPLNEEQ